MVKTLGQDWYSRHLVKIGSQDTWSRLVFKTLGQDGWSRHLVKIGIQTLGQDGWSRHMVKTHDKDTW